MSFGTVPVRTVGVAALLALFTPATLATADDGHAEDRRTITVNGRAEVSVPADMAVLGLSVETTSPRADTAVTENAARSEKVAKAIRGLLGKEDKVQTAGYSLQPRYEQRKDNTEPKIIGYVASNEVRVEVHDVDAVGKIIDAAIQSGANRVGSLAFTVEDADPPRRQALERAGRLAREQAETIAGSLGLKLGRVMSANAGYPHSPMPKRMEAFASMARSSMPETPIEAGDVNVSADVTVVFEIE